MITKPFLNGGWGRPSWRKAESGIAEGSEDRLADALVVLETPVQLEYNRSLVYREAWASFRAPVLSLLREISVKQMIEIWYSGGYVSQHSTSELIDLLNPVSSISRIKDIPILLAYGNRDLVAPPATARAMHQAAPWAETLTAKNASHVTLTLMPEVNQQIARWLRGKLS